MDSFDLDAARSANAYRSARLALIEMRAHRLCERTDASARQVEAALAEASEALGGAGPRARNKTARLPLASCDL
jgi:hypothetical protein